MYSKLFRLGTSHFCINRIRQQFSGQIIRAKICLQLGRALYNQWRTVPPPSFFFKKKCQRTKKTPEKKSARIYLTRRNQVNQEKVPDQKKSAIVNSVCSKCNRILILRSIKIVSKILLPFSTSPIFWKCPFLFTKKCQTKKCQNMPKLKM